MQETQHYTPTYHNRKAKASNIYGGGCYGAAYRCTPELLQSGKPMGAGLSDKTVDSIISVLPVSVSGFPFPQAGRAD